MLELLFKNAWIEIVFSKKNKVYGAYVLRKMYSRNVVLAFLIGTSIFACAIASPVVYDKLFPKVEEDELVFTPVNLSAPPPLDKKAPPPPPLPKIPNPPKPAMVRFPPPEPSENEHIPDPPIPTSAKPSGPTTQNGDPNPGPPADPGPATPTPLPPPPPEPEEEPVPFADELAVFAGGYPAYLAKNIKYPDQAAKMGIEGKVFVQFVVEKDGKVSNVKLLKGIGYGCDEEAIRVISGMPNWTPAKMNGRPVRLSMKIPVKYSLQ